MQNYFFDKPILNSPYKYPAQHWELGETGQPTKKIIGTRVKVYVKNHNFGLEGPYRIGSEIRKYRPDFIVLINDGHGDDDLLHLIGEINGFRREDAKEKKSTMDACWIPGVNNLKQYGRWAFVEFTDVYEMQSDFAEKVEQKFNEMIETLVSSPNSVEASV